MISKRGAPRYKHLGDDTFVDASTFPVRLSAFAADNILDSLMTASAFSFFPLIFLPSFLLSQH